MTRIKVEVTL